VSPVLTLFRFDDGNIFLVVINDERVLCLLISHIVGYSFPWRMAPRQLVLWLNILLGARLLFSRQTPYSTCSKQA
jgi:hypothetical protein